MFESKFEPLQVIWQSLRMLFQKTIESFDCKINGQGLGAALRHSLPSWAGGTGEQSHKVFLSQLQSLLAATGSLEENVLPLLWYWLCSRVKKVLMLCKFRAATSHFYFECEMKFSMELARSCCPPKLCSSLHSIFRSFIGVWVKIWHRNNTACSQSNLCKEADLNWRPVKEKGICSDSNRTAQRLQMAKRINLETLSGMILNRLKPKVCSQIGCKWNARFESLVVTSNDCLFKTHLACLSFSGRACWILHCWNLNLATILRKWGPTVRSIYSAVGHL